jgi:hypothetical protein
MANVFNALARAMVPSGIAVFVVGPSIIHGALVDNAEITIAASLASGFECIARAKRTIPLSRKSFNTTHGRIVNEDVLVLRRI